MKIYIHTDLEGVSGIDRAEQVDQDGPEYGASCRKLMADLNAAVGALDGGATHVTVLDSHAGGGNFLLESLDERAENDTRPNGKWWGILDDSDDMMAKWPDAERLDARTVRRVTSDFLDILF